MGLFSEFTAAARQRGLLAEDHTPDFARTVTLVQDMPYKRASARDPETIIREWQGTCSGKHYLVARLAAELGVPSQLYHGCHRFTRENTPYLPEHLRDQLPAEGLPDVHTFLRAFVHVRWIVVDATWPAALAAQGFPATAEWDGTQDMVLGAPVEKELVVRGDAQSVKEQLLAEHCGEHLEARDRFLNGLAEWLGAALRP